MINKKIKNATKCVYEGITFDSKLELFAYKLLKNSNIEFELKKEFILQEKFKYNNESIREIKSIPDFYLPNHNCIIDTKGFANDVSPLKYKMLKYSFFKQNLSIRIYICKNQKEVEDTILKLKLKAIFLKRHIVPI